MRRTKEAVFARIGSRDALVLCAKAIPMAGLSPNAAVETVIPMKVEGRPAFDAVLRFVPVDRLLRTDTLSIDLSGLEALLVRVRVRAPLPVDLWSRGGGFLASPYPAVTRSDEWQDFVVPKGEYFASPRFAHLLGGEYGKMVTVASGEVQVVDMTTMPVPAWLRISIVDGTGRPTDQYALGLDNSVGNVLIDGAIYGPTARIPTKAGNVHMRVFDRSGTVVDEATVYAIDGSEVLHGVVVRSP